MNFLAHLYLSREDDELMIGNFIADSVKGNRYNSYREGIKKGILLHRAIDSFTDQHPVVKQSIERLRPGYGKYSGVIVDIFYDHFLALRWNEFCEESLEVFSKRIHSVMQLNRDMMPERSQHFLSYMLMHNIPLPYAEIGGVGSVLYGMSRRTKFENQMGEAVHELKEHHAAFEAEFRGFFPEVIVFCDNKKTGYALR